MGTCSSGDLALWVGTDLDRFESEPPHVFADDVVISGVCYRRLDAPYYAWLRSRVAAAKRARDAGRLPAASFETVRERFNAVHAWAVAHLGEDALVAAVRAFDPRTYEPPSIDDDGLPGVLAPLLPRNPNGSNGRAAVSAGAT